MTNSNGGNNILLGDSGYYTLYFTSPDKLKVMKGNDVELADWEQ